ncbi:hypothetical protein J6590_073768 [Homalodisca vitripennis]|nr:hypothetical protein J6590_073768 [Homalodisca vitripennis]
MARGIGSEQPRTVDTGLKPTVDEPPENEEKYITIDKGLVPTKKLYLFGDAYFTLNGSRKLHQNVIDCAIVALIKKLCKTGNNKTSIQKLVKHYLNIIPRLQHRLFGIISVT